METHLVWSLPKALTLLNNHLLLYILWSQITQIFFCFAFFPVQTISYNLLGKAVTRSVWTPWLCESGLWAWHTSH